MLYKALVVWVHSDVAANVLCTDVRGKCARPGKWFSRRLALVYRLATWFFTAMWLAVSVWVMWMYTDVVHIRRNTCNDNTSTPLHEHKHTQTHTQIWDVWSESGIGHEACSRGSAINNLRSLNIDFRTDRWRDARCRVIIWVYTCEAVYRR